jgi:hypothetical protein
MVNAPLAEIDTRVELSVNISVAPEARPETSPPGAYVPEAPDPPPLQAHKSNAGAKASIRGFMDTSLLS